jgi:hypothetical protein
MILMETTQGNRYLLADDGRILDRSNGPASWNYSGLWRITGIKLRCHSHHSIPLEDAVDDGRFGHGVVLDIDHGTYRQWGSERVRSFRRVRGSYVMHNDGRLPFTDQS